MKQQRVGEKLKYLREARDLKQFEVAEAVNLSRATISNIESGRRSLTLKTLKKFADFYKVDVSYFELDGEKDNAFDLLERTRRIFESEEVADEVKEELYLSIMKFYLKNKEK